MSKDQIISLTMAFIVLVTTFLVLILRRNARASFVRDEAVKSFGQYYETFSYVEEIMLATRRKIHELEEERDRLHRLIGNPDNSESLKERCARELLEMQAALRTWRKKFDDDLGLAYLLGHGQDLRRAKLISP